MASQHRGMSLQKSLSFRSLLFQINTDRDLEALKFLAIFARSM
jgi:hypothetical protein